jgi:hypothetical protein
MKPGEKERALRETLETTAYYEWLARGCPWGDPMTDWLAAERECLARQEGEGRERRSERRDPVPFLARIFERS